MKKSTLLISGLILASGMFSQNVQNTVNAQNDNDVTFKKCSSFSISKAIRDLPDAVPTGIFTESKDEHDRRHILPIVNPNAINKDGAVQQTHGTKSMSTTIQNWQGQSGSACPPDPTGAAGLTQYAQAVEAYQNNQNKIDS